ncbi:MULTISPECIES: DUF1576 domain-containing protein [unclassified Aerococcus]|uniref:DUF1576 domain-containing protein n=1 Tax=unclassified Aerococcus TaxID=2618060 RepID=UPI0025B9E733|nr:MULTISPECIES: DUF1576 domain-containing protein [unclassified Aerococcus]
MGITINRQVHRFLDLFFGKTEIKPLFFYTVATVFILFGLSVQAPNSLITGYRTILLSPSNLITDYFEVGGIGATFVNAGTLTLANTFFIHRYSPKITGPILAAVLTVMGFSFFGKNLYNSIPFLIGTYFYSKYSDTPIANLLLGALFSSALSPVVSLITFGQGLPIYVGMPIGILAGVAIGFVIHPVSASFIRFHQGFNLYNIGFTAGVIGLVIASIMRVFELPVTYDIQPKQVSSPVVTWFFIIFSLFLFLAGFILNDYSFKGLSKIRQSSGQLISDFVIEFGTSIILMNMGILGGITIAYVHVVGGQLEGAVVGAVLTVMGFAAFGKHPFNIIPIMIGIYLMQIAMHIDNPNSTNALLAALFGTTLAPIAGQYGWVAGLIAGALHAAVVNNTGNAHAGLNLYNNGFSGGFIAAFLVPILDVIKERIEEHERIRKS